jgi:Short C-terminal domain
MQNPFKRIKDPVEGRMHVLGCTVINPDVMRTPCHITYVIQAEGVAAFSGDRVFELWCKQWPDPGDDLPVVFDRERTDRIEIQWHRIHTHAGSAQMHAEQPAQQRALGIGFDGDAVVGHAPPAAPPSPSVSNDAVISQLERLGTLRDTGVITADEFETQKHRILGTATTSPRTGESPEHRAPAQPAGPAAEPMAVESESMPRPAPPR